MSGNALRCNATEKNEWRRRRDVERAETDGLGWLSINVLMRPGRYVRPSMRVWQGARVGSGLSGQEEESATTAERKVGTTTGQ